jgi:hypothetical protein
LKPDFSLVSPALPHIANLTFSNDEGVLRNTLAAMALVLPVVPGLVFVVCVDCFSMFLKPESNMLARVLDLLSWQADSQIQTVSSALNVVCEVIKMDHAQTKSMIDVRHFPVFSNVLNHVAAKFGCSIEEFAETSSRFCAKFGSGSSCRARSKGPSSSSL